MIEIYMKERRWEGLIWRYSANNISGVNINPRKHLRLKEDLLL